MDGGVEAIFTPGAGGQPMRRVDEARALAGVGLEGDRYATGRGYWSAIDTCQVTLIEAEALEEVAERGVAIADGQHRRNVVTRNIRLRELTGARFSVGEPVLSF